MQKYINVLFIFVLLTADAHLRADVTIYGKMHVSLDYFSADSPVPEQEISDIQVSSNASRVGFRGSGDLGGGLEALWQVESEVRVDEGARPSFAHRNSFLGLSGGWGTALAGKYDTPFKIVGRKLDLFGDTAADTRGITGISPTGGPISERTPNTVAYISPDFSGFTAMVGYSADSEESNNPDRPDENEYYALSVNGIYDQGSLFVGGAFDSHSYPGDEVITGWRVGGSYKLEDIGIKLGGQFESLQNSESEIGVTTFGLFGKYRFGKESVKIHYYNSTISNGIDLGASHIALGFGHRFNENTQVYVQYVGVSNDDGSHPAGIGGPEHGDQLDGQNPMAISAGLVTGLGAESWW